MGIDPAIDGIREALMKILALEVERPGLPPGAFTPHLAAEARRVWDLQQRDVVREIYFRADRHAAVLVLECPDLESARAVLAGLPLVQAELIDFELIPLAPYPGLGRLFADRPEAPPGLTQG
jgi:muconolactone delta-isomerase